MNQNFEPIYAALTTLLISAATVTFTATATAGSPILTAIPTTASLTPGLSLISAGALPVGEQIQSVDSGSQITMLAPSAVGGTITCTAGFAPAAPGYDPRLLMHWSEVPQANMPALFVTHIDEMAEKRIGQLTKWTINARAWVYCNAPDDQTPPSRTLNALLGAIRTALGPDASGPGRVQFRQTLGGLVLDAWIQGKIETDEGYLGQKAVAKVPIQILVNGP